MLDLHIYGVKQDATGRWVAFNEESGLPLSSHATKGAALAVCWRYTDCELRRRKERARNARVRRAFKSALDGTLFGALVA